jgi:hypothetical protein
MEETGVPSSECESKNQFDIGLPVTIPAQIIPIPG